MLTLLDARPSYTVIRESQCFCACVSGLLRHLLYWLCLRHTAATHFKKIPFLRQTMGYPVILYAVTSIQEVVAQSGGLARGTIDSEKEDYAVGQDG